MNYLARNPTHMNKLLYIMDTFRHIIRYYDVEVDRGVWLRNKNNVKFAFHTADCSNMDDPERFISNDVDRLIICGNTVEYSVGGRKNVPITAVLSATP
ncbi:hypothetical protein Bhyg_17153 [Pseudolycoriella hygida]|uniref:Uncharacterized protein n=1 Tax=Pseudolycoriella hygida TaxID=35572 RepID=A0A9Q0MJ95_9DIPT|nr:hypothetical protein Bhyg_17153 [Pseudolycoriella hygida]